MEYRSPDCVQHYLPATRKQPDRNFAEYREAFAQVLPKYSNFTSFVDEDQTFIDVESRKVHVHARSHAETLAGTYENEYAFVLKITEDGQKVQEVWEWLDTEYTNTFAAKLAGKEPKSQDD